MKPVGAKRWIVTILAASGLVAQVAAAGITAAGVGGETTLDRTIVAEGEKDLGYGPGQPYVTRLMRVDDPVGTEVPLLGFKHVSDIHVVDEESPGRVEYFDVCGSPFGGAYRVQEAMSTQVGNSMLEQLAQITTGPATGLPLEFLVSTGDNIDNNHRNEQRWFIRLLDGDTVNPNSGGPGYDGYDRSEYSQALSRDILELAQQPFDSVGTGIPWYAVLGNHDGLAQGNAQRNDFFETVSTGPLKAFVDLDTYDDCPGDPTDVIDLIQTLLLTQGRPVPPDPDRHFLTHDELVAEYFDTTGQPVGHGLENAPFDPYHDGPAGYYSWEIAPGIQGISLDTIAYPGLSEGNITDPQFQWLEEELTKWHRRYWDDAQQRTINPEGENKLILIFSHHSSLTLFSPGPNPEGAPYHCHKRNTPGWANCLESEGLNRLLHRFPNVVAWVNGHEHNNRVTEWPAGPNTNPIRDYWEINTAAHIDWPQQSRLIEIAYVPGVGGAADTLVIYGTAVDHAAAVDPDETTQSTTDYLASISRVEAYYDACVRTGQADCEGTGTDADRNVRLLEKAPFDLGP